MQQPVTLPEFLPDSSRIERYAQFGDYIGGVYGTLIALLTVVLIAITWRTARRSDYRSRIYAIFTEMMKTHEDIVSSMKIGESAGREVFGIILSEFMKIYRICGTVTRELDTGWSTRERIDIAYTYVFFGTISAAVAALEIYDSKAIKAVHDGIHAARSQEKDKKRRYSGHQNRLSHYHRNLFSAYSFIESSQLSGDEKLALGKVLRSKLTNYEQAVLALNIISHLGDEWEHTGLAGKYKVVKNIPKRFFRLDQEATLKGLFPNIDFEWEKQRSTHLRTSSFKFLNWRVYVHRSTPRRYSNYSPPGQNTA